MANKQVGNLSVRAERELIKLTRQGSEIRVPSDIDNNLTFWAVYWKSKFPRWRIFGCEGLLLERGLRFQRGDPPPRRGGWYRTPKACYQNAFLNVQQDPARFVYVEGRRCGKHGPLSHAWFVDRKDPKIAFDTTPTWGNYMGFKIERDEAALERAIYIGVPLKWSFVLRNTLTSNCHESQLEGEGVWPRGGPSIYTGAEPPESFIEEL